MILIISVHCIYNNYIFFADNLTNSTFTQILPLSTNTSSVSVNPHHSQTIRYSDNIFLTSSANIRFTGISGVVRQGLTHMAIPRGWTWGGPASEHCPIWCELFIQMSENNKKINPNQTTKKLTIVFGDTVVNDVVNNLKDSENNLKDGVNVNEAVNDIVNKLERDMVETENVKKFSVSEHSNKNQVIVCEKSNGLVKVSDVVNNGISITDI